MHGHLNFKMVFDILHKILLKTFGMLWGADG